MLAKLSRQYIDGYATTQRFNQAVNQLTRGVELGKIEMTQASAILDGIYRKYGMMADAARIAERGQIELSKAVQQANARFEEQSRVVPANRIGAVIANDNQAQFRRQNLGAQVQDIGVSLYGGMPVTTVLLQQGSQIVGLYGGNGGVNALLKDLGVIISAAARYLGPFAAAGALAYGVYKLFAANTAEAGLAVSDLTKSLAAQAAPMGAVQSQLSELQRLQADYAKALNTTARTHDVASAAIVAGTEREYEAKRALLELELKRQEAARAVAQSELEITSLRLRAAVAQQVTTNMDLERQGFSDPRIGRFTQLPDSITGLEKTRDVLANNPLSDKVKELNANLSLTDIALQKLREGLGLVGPAASGQVGQINELSKALEELRRVGTAAISPIDEATRRAMAAIPVVNGVLDEEARRRVLAGQREAQRRIDNQNPTVVNGDGVRVGVPMPTARPNIEMEGLPGEEKAGKSAAEAYRDLIKNANDRIEQMKLEAKIAGETGIAQQKMRMELELLQQAQEKGRTVTAEQRAEIEKLSEAYAKAATEAAKVRLNADLRFEREQLFRSSDDQQIASRLRGVGLPVDLDSQEARVMRENIRIQELRNGVKGFFTDFRDGLLQGDSIGKALGDAIINALNNALTKLTDRWIEQLVNSIVGTGAGGGLLGSLGIGGAGANDNFKANTTLGQLIGANDNLGSAPVIPVTRGSLGSISAYAAAIRSIESSGNYSALGPVTSSGDRAYGAYQVMGANVAPWTRQALGYSLSPSQFLASSSAQDAVFQKVYGGYVSRYGASGAAQAWFGGPGSVGGGGNAADMLGTTGTQYVDKFNNALMRLSGTTESATGGLQNFSPAVGSATQSLGTFGNGLGQMGNTLSTGAAGGGSSGGGGLFGWLSSIFGGGSASTGVPASSVFNVRGYADGTDFAPGGLTMVGERGRELVNLPRGSQVVPNHKTEAMLGGSRSPANVNVKFNVINNNGSNVRTERRDTNDGPQFDLIIDEAVAAKLNTPGSRTRRAAKSQFGLTEGLARR
ncbi:phage tail length tape measure family protein [Rhizobium chutanense]|uniref:phage tail length tape measure family protein n=1 Tax=Rhizobium chutanense TaxID=2035448 RepID=UPI0013DF3535|nr:phage tail length tape measure family protein [Rhizobium chutanense]